jgi:hypothetical protein
MLNKDDIQSLMQKPISRKQFLTQVGLAIVAIIGIPAILKNLQSAFSSSVTKEVTETGAYGWSAYSGIPAHPSVSTTRISKVSRLAA